MNNEILKKVEELEALKDMLRIRKIIAEFDIKKSENSITISSVKLIDENDSYPGKEIDFSKVHKGKALLGSYYFEGMDDEMQNQRLLDIQLLIDGIKEVAVEYKEVFEMYIENGVKKYKYL